MFLVSLKSLKGKFFILLAAVVAVVTVCVIVSKGNSPVNNNEALSRASTVVNYSADASNQIKYINNLGYTVKTEPDSVTEIMIPEEFDDVYSNYNELQKQAMSDLTPYKGCKVKKWSYTVTNYPDYQNKDCIKINLLTYNNRIIGGDVCSVEIGGFMTGLIKCPKNA